MHPKVIEIHKMIIVFFDAFRYTCFESHFCKERIFLKHPFRMAAAALMVMVLLTLTGCGSGSNSFTWFVDTIPANLDPQVASTASDVIACENLYSGLVREKPSGEIEPALCERWEKSADGRTYIFYLKDGLTYVSTKGNATEYAITAEDFVFAFRRMFRAETNSPYAVEFSALENSAEVLAGQLPESSLGVSASGPLTLVFHLSSADDNFLSKLTLPGAMPCDEEFFNSTRGTYGLTVKTTLSSGPFYIYNWTSSGLFLRREPSGTLIDSLRLVQNTNNADQPAVELINSEKCSAAMDDTGSSTSLSSISYSDTTWSLLFNCNTLFASTPLRQSLAGVAREAAVVPSTGLYAAASGLVPDGLNVDGMNYRETIGEITPAAIDVRALYLEARQGMANSDFNKITLMLPAGCGLNEAAETINGAWQKELSLFFSIEEVDEETFNKRLADGDYSIALAPISAEGGSVYNMLAQFTSSGGGLTGYSNALYSTQLEASTHATGTSRCRLLGECERQLLDDCVVVPLFAQQKRLLIASGVKDLIFDPFGPVLDLTYTTKE